jgi:hypothetical protein
VFSQLQNGVTCLKVQEYQRHGQPPASPPQDRGKCRNAWSAQEFPQRQQRGTINSFILVANQNQRIGGHRLDI